MRGLSPWFLLFTAIFSNVQLSDALLINAYEYPSDTRHKHPVLYLVGKGDLTGWAAFGALLGLLQIALQWTLSTIL